MLLSYITVGNHVIFCTYIRKELVGKLITVCLILNEFSCDKKQIPHRFCSKSLLKRRFHARCIVSHNLEHSLLEVAWENTARSIKH